MQLKHKNLCIVTLLLLLNAIGYNCCDCLEAYASWCDCYNKNNHTQPQ